MDSKGKGFFAFVALAGALFIGSFAGATHYGAATLSYNSRLGPPLAIVAHPRLGGTWT